MIIVTGARGQLGIDVADKLKNGGYDVLGIDIAELDITDKSKVEKFITTYRPEWLIHLAAYTAVDKAEDEPEICSLVNVTGTENLALACKQADCPMLYISTDYVYDGTGNDPRSEDSTEELHPLSVYGTSKLSGEQKIISNLDKYVILRTSWVFGIHGKNFVDTMLRLGRERSELTVVDDQVGSPTYTVDLANLICEIIEKQCYGIFHATNEGFCSWAQFAEKIMEMANLNCKIIPILSKDYPQKACRPKNSRLSKQKLVLSGLTPFLPWEDALNRYLKEISAIEKSRQ